MNLILEVAISLAFMYCLLSIAVSSINEVIVYYLKERGKFLCTVLEEVLKDTGVKRNFTKLLYAHPLIDRLKKNNDSLPSYISATQFSESLIDTINMDFENKAHSFISSQEGGLKVNAVSAIPEDAYLKFKKAVEIMPFSDVKILLNSFLNGTESYDKLKANIQNWFNDYMDRTSGWYKAKQQWSLFIISCFVVIAFNVDTISVVKTLSRQDALRTQISSAAEKYAQSEIVSVSAKDSTNSDVKIKPIIQNIQRTKSELKAIGFPIGWGVLDCNKTFFEWSIRTLGWLISALALSFGAPFWFETLNKLINVRKTGIKPVAKVTL